MKVEITERQMMLIGHTLADVHAENSRSLRMKESYNGQHEILKNHNASIKEALIAIRFWSNDTTTSI